jgi:NADH-quinone oxidoreductase subunit H
MNLGWKVLIPVALVWTMVTATFVLIDETGGIPAGTPLGLAGAAAVILLVLLFARRTERPDARSLSTSSAIAAGETPRLDQPGSAEVQTTDREEVTMR